VPDAQAEYGTVSTGRVRYWMHRWVRLRKPRRGTEPDVKAEYGTVRAGGVTVPDAVQYRIYRRSTVPLSQA